MRNELGSTLQKSLARKPASWYIASMHVSKEGMVNFAERVRKLRKDRGMTQGKLAEASGLTQTTIWRIEKDRLRELKQGALVRLADALETSMDYLAGRGDMNTALGLAEADPAIRALVGRLIQLSPEERRSKLGLINFFMMTPEEIAQIDFSGINLDALREGFANRHVVDPPPAHSGEQAVEQVPMRTTKRRGARSTKPNAKKKSKSKAK